MLSAAFRRWDASGLGSFLWHFSGLVLISQHVSFAEGSRAECITPGGISWGWEREWITSLDLPATLCLCNPGYSLPSGKQTHLASSCPVFHLPISPSPSLQGFCQSNHCSICTTRDYSGLCEGPLDRTWTDWKNAFPLVYKLSHKAWGHSQACWEYTPVHYLHN